MHVAPMNSIQPNAVTNQNQKQPPAQAARDLLPSRADLASEPFGKLVSLFARGQAIPPAPTRSKCCGHKHSERERHQFEHWWCVIPSRVTRDLSATLRPACNARPSV